MTKDLKYYRREKGFTQANMAELLGITPGHYAHLEKGRRKVKLELAHKISSIMNLTIEEVFFAQKQSASYSVPVKNDG